METESRLARIAPSFAVALLLVCLLSCAAPHKCQPQSDGDLGDRSLLLELKSDCDLFSVGKPLHFTLTLTNTATSGPPVLIESPDTPILDMVLISAEVVVSGDKLILPMWSDKQTPETLLHHLELAPGENYRIEWTWTPNAMNRDEPSIYVAGYAIRTNIHAMETRIGIPRCGERGHVPDMHPKTPYPVC